MAKFKVGDFVKIDKDNIGIVEWVENKCMNLKEEDGMIGVSLLTNTRGFAAPVKEDSCIESSIEEVVEWWQNKVREKEESANLAYVNKDKFNRLQKENKILKELLRLYL